MINYTIPKRGSGNLTFFTLVYGEQPIRAGLITKIDKVLLQAEQLTFQIQGEFGHSGFRLFTFAGLEVSAEEVLKAGYFRPYSTQSFHVERMSLRCFNAF
jgi:hypothetical protein